MASGEFSIHTVMMLNLCVIPLLAWFVSDYNFDGLGAWQVAGKGWANDASYTDVNPRDATAD